MQSDDRVNSILEQLASQRDLFRSAVAEASEQLRSVLSGYRNSTDNDVERAAFELGRFARGRIDPALFALVFADDKTVDPGAIAWVDRAEAVLQEVASTTHLLQYTRVAPGGSLRMSVDRALARIGRAFGAVRVAEYARSGRSIGVEAKFLDVFPFALWNRSERRIGLPLVVEVEGKDLHAGGLEEFLDGTQTIVLLVNGAAPPAPLARLMTPNVLVMQTTEVADIGNVVTATGPAIAAIVPENCARFVHRDGSTEVKSLGSEGPLTALGKIGVFQQREELLQLMRNAQVQLAGAAETEVVAAPAAEDVLAAWLLRQADVA